MVVIHLNERQPRRYLVILADRQKGRFFTLFRHSLEDQGKAIFDEVPQKVKAEGTRVGKMARHIQDHLYQHLKNVSTKAKYYLIKRRPDTISGVIIGGHQEMLNQIKRTLPSSLRSKVTGQFIADLNQPLHQLAKKATQLLKIA